MPTTVRPDRRHSSPLADVDGFVDRFAAALVRRDAPGCADLWGDAAMIVADQFAATPTTRQELESFLAHAWPIYDYLDLARIDWQIVDRVELSESMTRIRVQFAFYDRAEAHLTDGQFEYLLRRDSAGLRCYVGVNIDAEPNLAGLARNRGHV